MGRSVRSTGFCYTPRIQDCTGCAGPRVLGAQVSQVIVSSTESRVATRHRAKDVWDTNLVMRLLVIQQVLSVAPTECATSYITRMVETLAGMRFDVPPGTCQPRTNKGFARRSYFRPTRLHNLLPHHEQTKEAVRTALAPTCCALTTGGCCPLRSLTGSGTGTGPPSPM